MDPNACLAEIRRDIAIMNDHGELSDAYLDAAVSLAVEVAALDVWLSGGGFPPIAWDGKSTGRYATQNQEQTS